MTPDRHRCATQLSFWLPGLGQLYLHRWWRGAVMLAASWITFDQAWRACSATWAVAAVAVWIIAVRDANRTQPRITRISRMSIWSSVKSV